ncbi:hypothetical protein M9H77_18649 [Catharanthus roseus]|uniref:Uncharacterized protein n=1 Tax=Catharanthus roseus TaxID=4058 RepID=A0ACC0B808_CATRO|nr:hypothetical protein M9H77_18649 [Catharanthus roseus]
MDATHPVRIRCVWSSFHRSGKKTWKFTRMVTHAQLIRKSFKYMNNDDKIRYLWAIRPDISKEGIHVLVKFEPDDDEDDEDDDDDDADYDVSSVFDNDNNDNDEEDDISTPLNLLYSTKVNQWQNMGSGEQIDNFIESRTIRLLAWNDAMTNL